MSPRILATLTDPLIHLLIFLCLALILKKWRIRVLLLALVETVFVFFSTVPIMMLENLEAQIRPVELTESHPAVYLGGDCLLENLSSQKLTTRGCALRAVETLRDTKSNRFKELVLSGYTDPDMLTTHRAEMLSIQDLAKLVAPNLPTELEMGSRNTYENALEVKRLIGVKEPIYLYTSAAHMPRAKRVFEKLGFQVLPRPVDYQALGQDLNYVRKIGWHSYRTWRLYWYEETATWFYYFSGRI